MPREQFRCFLVEKSAEDKVETTIAERPVSDLPAGEVLIEVAYSSLNYKDALAARGHPGVVRHFPHVPGIDAAGTVVESQSEAFRLGDRVIASGYGLGSEHWGGWAECIRVPADWVVPLPEGLSLREAMIYGTAGFTAALSVEALERHEISPEAGDVLVTGATGGVGIMAVKLLAHLGYRVVASSGKTDQFDWLKHQGASQVIARSEVNDQSARPLLSARWAGAIDAVGGNTLATVLRSSKVGGCVAACGLVGGADLPVTVYPFILRGVILAGIGSAWIPRDHRLAIWQKLAAEWKLDRLAEIAEETSLDRLTESVEAIFAGHIRGRVVVALSGE